MTDVLILGGTGWLSGRVARALGAMPAPPSRASPAAAGRRPTVPTLVVADRAEPGAYDACRRPRVGRGRRHLVDPRARRRGGRCARRADAALDLRLVAVGLRDERRGRAPTRPLRCSEPARAGRRVRLRRARRPRPRHPSAPRSAIARRSCGPGSSSARATPPTGSGTGSARFALAGDEAVLAPTVEGLARAGDRRRRPRRVHRARGAERLARRGQRDRRHDAARRRCSRSRARPPVTPASSSRPTTTWLDGPRRGALGGAAVAAAVAAARHAGLLRPARTPPTAPPAAASRPRARRSSAPSPTSARAASTATRSRACRVPRSSRCSARARSHLTAMPRRGCRRVDVDLRRCRDRGRYRRPMPSARPGLRDARSERRSRAPTSGRTPTLGDPAHLLRRAAAGVAVSGPRPQTLRWNP